MTNNTRPVPESRRKLFQAIHDILTEEIHPYRNEDGVWVDDDDMEKSANRIIDEVIQPVVDGGVMP